jgi:predicted metal-dependent hydrolase
MEYRVFRSKRKTLSLQVNPDLTVVVRAPKTVSQRQIERFVEQHRDWLGKALERTAKRQVKEANITQREEALKQAAKEYLPKRTCQWAARMGVSPRSVRITSAKTRFGSCSPKNGICYSWRLMAYPPKAVDYVIVHELAHILQKNHSRKFYQIVQTYLPDWKERRDLLKE